MTRVLEIVDIRGYTLLCRFNNDELRRLDVKPLIENHLHLPGVAKLLENDVFASVKVGECGEIVWPNIVDNSSDLRLPAWDYDISPEFAYEHSN